MAIGLVHPHAAITVPTDKQPGVTDGPRDSISRKGMFRKCSKEPDIFGQRRRIRFLLVDDQFDLGYHHILGSVLFGNQYKAPTNASAEWVVALSQGRLDRGVPEEDRFSWELRCAPTADALLNSLNTHGPVDDWHKPHYFDPGVDILLLDLRLWAEDEDKSDRQAFMADIIRLCETLRVADESGSMRIADPHFERAYRQALSLKEGEDVSEIEALVLLPLLLSYCDPSLPIILFSSTHQRSVVEMVAHRPSIITNFAKPLLSGYGEEQSPAQLVADLHRALVKAIALHEARCVWKRIVDIEWKNTPVFEVRSSRKEFVIFNKPAEYEIPDDRYYVQESVSPTPLIQKETLRSRLANYYVNYIQRRSYFDFASVPWELIEATLTPREILQRVYDPQFKIDPALHDDEYGPNYPSVVLETIRNKKTHGGGRPPTNSGEEEDYRLAALLEFMILLDFIEGAQEPETLSSPTLQDLWNALTSRHSDLTGGPRKLHDLNPEVTVSWIEFVGYAGLRAVELARADNRRHLSNLTTLAARRLALSLMMRP